MKTERVDRCFANQGSTQKRRARAILVALALGALGLGAGGCATDGYVGVTTYPNYSPYYAEYGYGGIPYYGYGGIYTRNIIVRNRRHSGSYGRHHFWRDRGGNHRRDSFSRPGGFRRSPGIRRQRR